MTQLDINRKRDVLRFLQGGGSHTAKQVGDALGLVRKTASVHLNELAERGHVTIGGSRKLPTYTLTLNGRRAVWGVQSAPKRRATGWPVMNGTAEDRDALFVRKVVTEAAWLGLLPAPQKRMAS